jgi:hypothetical protein
VKASAKLSVALWLCYHPPMTPHDQQRFSQVTLVGLIIAIFGSAFMFGGRPVIAAMLLLLGWVLVVLDEDMRSGRAARANRLRMIPRR